MARRKKFICLLFLYLYLYTIHEHNCDVKWTKYTRLLELNNHVTRNDTRMSARSIIECSNLCFKYEFCTSFIFNVRSQLCVSPTGGRATFIQEDDWIFFNTSLDCSSTSDFEGNMSNLAYKKLTLQSSTFQHNGNLLSSDKAVDGINITNNEVHPCASTMKEARPYWYVDLGQEHFLKYVEIVNRGDCCPERLHDVEVTVAGHYKDFKKPCGFFKGPGTAGQIVVLNCPQETKGRYIKIQIVDGIDNFLTLCEVRVIGK